jgi:hypothetical protein
MFGTYIYSMYSDINLVTVATKVAVVLTFGEISLFGEERKKGDGQREKHGLGMCFYFL